MAEGGGPTVGNFYFDVIFRDANGNDAMEQHLRDRIKRIEKQNLRLKLDLTEFNTQIAKVREELKSLGAAGTTAFDASRFAQMQQQLEGYAEGIKAIAELVRDMNRGGGDGFGNLKAQAAESMKNSYNTLLLTLREVEAEYNKLEQGSRNGSKGAEGLKGRKLLSEIQQLKAALKEIESLKNMTDSIGDNEGLSRLAKAQAEFDFAASQTGRSIAELKAQTAATNRETAESARVANMARDSYDQLQAELKKTIADYKAMSEAVRGTRRGSDTLAYIHELQERIKAIDDAIKPVKQNLSKLEKLQNQLNGLRTSGSDERKEVITQREIDMERQLLRLEEQKASLDLDGANAVELRIQRLQNEVSLRMQIDALAQRSAALRDPSSDEREAIRLRQEIALQEQQLNLENQRAQLLMQLTHQTAYGREEAMLKEELNIKRQLAQVDAQLAHYDTFAAQALRSQQQELAIKREQTRLEQERVNLERTLRELQSGQDRRNRGLQEEVSLEEQLVKMRTKRAWLEKQSSSGSGKTNAQEWREMSNAISKLTGNAPNIKDMYTQLGRQLPLLESLRNMARNYIGVFGAVSFVRKLYDTRAEFERQEVALRALMQSATQARQVMGELQQMALKSPFGIADIIGFSKQLSAFSIGNNELVDTTKRLADLSAGLGVDMSRLILAYGQVKAATVLRGQELRQFTEAGVPMVRALADEFTKLEGRVVTAADVFDRISKKAVSFEMVKKVLDSMTSEGGRFYDHQAKMVETLYGKMERMSDAYKMMLNQMGSSMDSILKAPVDAITKALINWRSALTFIVSGAIASGIGKLLGYFRTIQGLAKNANINSLAFIRGGLSQMVRNLALPGVVFALTEVAGKIIEIKSAVAAVNSEIRQMGKDLSQDIGEFLKNNREPIKLAIAADSGATEQDLAKIWEKLQDEFEHLAGSEIKLGELLNVSDLRVRSREAISYLESVEQAAKALENVKDIDLPQTLGWKALGLNLGLGTADRLDDLSHAIDVNTRAIDGNISAWERWKLSGWGRDITHISSNSDAWDIEYNQGKIKEDAQEIAKSIKNQLDLAFEQGLDKNNTEAVGAYIDRIIDSINNQMPNLDRETRAYFNSVLIPSIQDAGVMIDDTIFRNKAALAMFQGWLEKAAHDSGKDIKDVLEKIKSDVSGTKESAEHDFYVLCQKALEHAKESASGMYSTYAAMVANLSKLEIVIGSRIIGPAGEVSSFRRNWNEANPMVPEKYAPKNDEFDSGAYGKRMHEEEKKAKAAKNTAKIQAQRLTYEASIAKTETQREAYTRQAAIASKNAADYAADEAHYSKQASIYYVDLDKNGGVKTPKAKKTGGGSKRDTWLDNIKNRISEFKEAQSEIEKLRKMGMSQAEAIDKVMSMSWTYGLDKAKLGRGGTKKMVDALIPLVEEHGKGLKGAFKQANDKLLLDLQKMSHDEQLKQYEEDAKKIGDEIRNRIETGVKNWKLYDTLFEATGDEAMSANVAFGGKKLFKNLEEQLIAIFNENTSGISFEEAVKMDETSLREVMTNGEAYIDLLKRIKEARENGFSDIMTEAAKAIEEQMTLEQQIQRQRILNQKKIQEYIERNGGAEAVANNPALKEGLDALEKSGEDMIDVLEAQALEYSDLWEKIFGKLTYKSYGQVKAYKRMSREIVNNAEIKSYDKYGRPKMYISEYIDEEGVKQKVKLTASDLKKLKENFDNLDQELQKKNPFRRLIDLINEIRDKIRNGDKVPKELFAELADSASACADIVSGVASSLGSMFKALGKGGEQFEDMSKFFDSISNLAKGFVQGGYVGLAVAAIGETASWIQRIAEAGDKALQERIDKQSAALKAWSNMYSDFEREISRRLGSIYADFSDFSSKFEKERKADQWWAMYGEDFGMAALNANNTDWEKFFSERTLNEALSKGDIYTKMFQDLVNQRDATLKQLDEEQSKKNSDDGAIEDYRNQISQLDDQIRHFAEDMAKSLYDIDVKNWAKELTDAVVSAWQNGENAAEAYKNKVKDIIADVTKNVISQKIMEMALAPVLDAVVGEMTAKNGMLDEESLIRFANELSVAGTGAVNTITGLLDKMKELGYDLSGTTDKAGTLGQGIKSITEDQANLLASYLNAMRADLSIVRLMWEQHAAGTSVVAQAQLTQLNAIAANTLRNAEAAERIETAFNSVITIGASGARIRV